MASAMAVVGSRNSTETRRPAVVIEAHICSQTYRSRFSFVPSLACASRGFVTSSASPSLVMDPCLRSGGSAIKQRAGTAKQCIARPSSAGAHKLSCMRRAPTIWPTALTIRRTALRRKRTLLLHVSVSQIWTTPWWNGYGTNVPQAGSRRSRRWRRSTERHRHRRRFARETGPKRA